MNLYKNPEKDIMELLVNFERELLRDIPLARAMQLRVIQLQDDTLTLQAPLAPNINDKGCVFGGSLVSLLTLAGWSLVMLKLKLLDSICDVFVQSSTIHYHVPIWEDFSVVAQLAEGENWNEFLSSLNTRGCGRLPLIGYVPLTDQRKAVSFEACYVAKIR